MATHYIDFGGANTKGAGTVHDGLKEDVTAAGAAKTTSTTLAVAQGDFDNDGDDEYNGDYVYNVNRSAGAAISDYDGNDDDGASIITHGEIAGQAAGDTCYILRAYNTPDDAFDTDLAAGETCYIRALSTCE